MEENIKSLVELGSAGIQQAIEGYARWYLVSAICWFLVGIVLVICGIKVAKHTTEKLDWSDEWNECIRYVAAGIIVLLGLLFIIHNLCTIIAPAAYATHHFIMDIKPN